MLDIFGANVATVRNPQFLRHSETDQAADRRLSMADPKENNRDTIQRVQQQPRLGRVSSSIQGYAPMVAVTSYYWSKKYS